VIRNGRGVEEEPWWGPVVECFMWPERELLARISAGEISRGSSMPRINTTSTHNA
jgi:hypothetical protein